MIASPSGVNLSSSSNSILSTGVSPGGRTDPVSHISEQVRTMNKLPGQDGIPLVGVSSPSLGIQQPQPVTLRQSAPSSIPSSSTQGESKVLDKRRIQELVKEVDPMEQLDEEVEEALLSIADDFIDSVVTAACQIAKHRKSNTLEVKDVQLHLDYFRLKFILEDGSCTLVSNSPEVVYVLHRLNVKHWRCQAKIKIENTLSKTIIYERNWNMWIPGFGSDELRPYKKSVSTEAHKQRMALIRKTLKKY